MTVEATSGLAGGFSGIWYSNQPQEEYGYKYSGGLGTYPQQMAPIAVYAPEVERTYFTFGGATDGGELENLVAFYDHRSGLVCRPRRVLHRRTSDAHYNGTIAIDAEGYVHIFCNSHGTGAELTTDDSTFSRSYVFRGATPFSIDDLELAYEDNFSYSQVWSRADGTLLWLHTRYSDPSTNHRHLHWATLRDGRVVDGPREFAFLGAGDYQISGAWGDTVWTAFDYHPKDGGLNARTNIYLAQHDPENGWRDSHGEALDVPVTDIGNAARVRDYAVEGKLVYLKDIAFDRDGEPHVLYLLSSGPWSGPQDIPRSWRVLFRENGQWVDRRVADSSHNYDHGFLDIGDDGAWRVIAPLAEGPQSQGAGGEVVVLESVDRGHSWEKVRHFPVFDGRNQTYVRPVFNGVEGLWALWADGDAYERSPSSFYFADGETRMYRLPRAMPGSVATPEIVSRE